MEEYVLTDREALENSTNQTPLPRSKTLIPDYIIKVRYIFSIYSKRNFLYDYQIES